MGLNQERYFFLSGFISITFFLLLIVLGGYSWISPTKIKPFAMEKSDVISVSISDKAVNEQSIPDVIETPIPKEPIVPPIKRVESIKSEKVPEISDLFSHVKSQKIIAKPQVDTQRDDALSTLENELLSKKDNSRFSDKVKNIELVKPSIKMVVQGGSSGPIVNEYHAKIQGLIYTQFHPPSGTAGEAARVKITISASGDLIGYKVLVQSGSSTFNSEVDWLKDRLKTLSFPRHPEGKEAVLELILTTKR